MKNTARRSYSAKLTWLTPTSKTVKPGTTLSKAAKKANVKGPANGKEEDNETPDWENAKVL